MLKIIITFEHPLVFFFRTLTFSSTLRCICAQNNRPFAAEIICRTDLTTCQSRSDAFPVLDLYYESDSYMQNIKRGNYCFYAGVGGSSKGAGEVKNRKKLRFSFHLQNLSSMIYCPFRALRSWNILKTVLRSLLVTTYRYLSCFFQSQSVEKVNWVVFSAFSLPCDSSMSTSLTGKVEQRLLYY